MGAAIDDALLDAGRRALRRWGHAGLTAERIAQEAGLSRVTLHRRGVTKDVVLEALTAAAVARYRELLWPVLTAGGTGRERLERALEVVCDAAEEHLELLVALGARQDAVFHERDDGETRTRGAFVEPLERLLRDAAADGTLAVADPGETATLLFNVVGWSYVHLRTGHGWTPERARGSVVALALRGAGG